jgi:hypothetical protein
VVVAALAGKPADCSAGDSQALAPERLVGAVEISVTRCWRGGRGRVSCEIRETDRSDGPGKLPLGCTANSSELLMLGYKVSQATVSRYLSTLHRRPDQSWRTFIRNQAFAFSYSDDLDHGNQDYPSLVECSSRGKFRGPADRIVRQGADIRSMSHTRDIAVRRRARGARLRTFRCDTAPDRALTARANPLSISAQMRGPPHRTEIPQSRRLEK